MYVYDRDRRAQTFIYTRRENGRGNMFLQALRINDNLMGRSYMLIGSC